MNVLCDFHHGELYESILKLFTDRLGYKVYRPIGREWHDENYWNIGDGDSIIDQYLGYNFSTEIEGGIWVEDGNQNKDYYNNVINVFDRSPHLQISLSRAKEMQWDLIISTMLHHFIPWESFRRQFCPKAKHIFQIGNVLPFIPEGVQNAINSTATDCSSIPNVIDYYQEFNPSLLERLSPINEGKTLYSFLIYNSGHRGMDFLKLEALMQDWTFREYGALCRDGNIHKLKSQCKKMQEAALTWLVKLNGDGYGYNLHRSLYAGRPVIVNYSTVYRNHRLSKLGYFIEGENFINYDDKPIEDLKRDILKLHSNWEQCSTATRSRLLDIVNFDNEEQKIRRFLQNLI